MKKGALWLLITVVVLLASVAATPGFAAGGDEGLEKAQQAQEKHTDALMKDSDVAGTAIGFNPAGKAAVLVFTQKEGVAGLPKELDGVPVHVHVTGAIQALDRLAAPALAPSTTHRISRYRPAPIGVSTGHPDITAGTIGARVKKGVNVYALSNNHVYANENQASIGDNVLQPGTYDGGVNPDDAIGTLAEFKEIKFDGSNNVIDAAIALSSTANLGNATLSDGYGTPRAATIPLFVNMKVKKYGRTTGLTKGKIWAINATVNVGYDSGVARFVNQIVIIPGKFSAGGDSGSLIVVDGGSNDRKAVGLLFAGSPSVTIANPIGPVLGEFSVTIDGQ
jgi:hypothetical protein